MSALTFWFWFIMIGSGCGFVAVGWLVIKAVKDRPRKPISKLAQTYQYYICPKCGFQIRYDYKLCLNCGTRIKWRR